MQGETTDDADFAILVVGSARVVGDRLGAAVEAAGVDDMRGNYGYVIRCLATGDRTLTELAQLLDVTKQAAIKVVDEMEARGFLTREPHPTDRRAKVLRLSAKGQTVREAALSASHSMERELRARVGDADVDAFRRVTAAFLELHGALGDATEGRARANW